MPNARTDEKSRITALKTTSEQKRFAAPPSLPPTLPDSYQGEWDALVRHMQEQAIWVDQKAPLLETYFFNVMAVREAQESIRKHGALFQTGAQNPASAVMVRHSATLNKLAEQLGLGKGKVAQPANPSEAKEKSLNTWGA